MESKRCVLVASTCSTVPCSPNIGCVILIHAGTPSRIELRCVSATVKWMRRQSLRALTSSGVPQRWPGQHHGRSGTRITPGGDSNLS